jgi:hypothetical protein
MTNRKRRLFLLGSPLALALLSISVLLWLDSQRPGVTRANFERLQEGMTKAQVEALLNGPPQHITPSGKNYSRLQNGTLLIGQTKEVWGGEQGAAIVVFDEQGGLLYKDWHDSPESFLDRIRRMIHL